MNPSDDHLSALRTLIVRTVREHTGMHERWALPIAQAIVQGLQQQWGGQMVRIPAISADDRAHVIRDALNCGMRPRDIAEHFGCHLATVYRALRSVPHAAGD